MTQERVDIVVIGGGAGGTPAAVRARQLGAETMLIEKEHLGGACMNRGCIPVKTLLETARLYRAMRKADRFGLKVAPPEIDWTAVMAKKDETVKYLRMGTESILKSNGVKIVRGQAVLTSPDRVKVGDREISAKAIIMAAGAQYAPPAIDGIGLPGVIAPDDVLSMTGIPASVAVLGSGPVELELAQYLSFLGAKVTVIEEDQRILPEEPYRELSGRLQKDLKDQGLEIETKAVVERIASEDGGLAVTYSRKNQAVKLKVEKVLHARREPALKGLGLEAAGLGGGLEVDERLRTRTPSILAIGDAAGGPFYSHRAAAMGIAAAENALGRGRPFDPDRLIRSVTTWPEAAAVGLTEKQAQKAGYNVTVGLIPYAINALGMIRLEATGMVKVVAEAEYGQVLGVHIVGPGASELISEGALAVEMEATVDDLAESVRYHPSFSESQVDAAREAMGRGIYVMR